MKISLILPAYNVAPYLEKCVHSCELQNIPINEFEVIIVNDGSTDNTLEIAERLSQQYNNIVVISQKNQGLSMARNNGAAIARGDYIWFIDTDDYITKNCLGEIISIMNKMNLCMFGVGPSIPFIEEFPTEFNEESDVTNVFNGIDWLLSDSNFIGAWGYVFKREFWNNLGFKFYPGIHYEDVEFIPKAQFWAVKIASLSTFSCYSYVQRTGSIMNSPITKKKILDHVTIAQSHMAFLKNLIADESCKDERVINRFVQLISSEIMSGITGSIKLKDSALFFEVLEKTKHIKRKVYGKSKIHKLYQWLVLFHPRLFFSVRKFF